MENKVKFIRRGDILTDVNDNGASEFEVPKGFVSIGHGAFRFCDKLRHVILPDTVENICYDAFSWHIDSINLEHVIRIGKKALVGYRGTSGISLDKAERIGAEAFLGCAFSEITFSENLISIGEGAFKGTNIERFKLPRSLKVVGDHAFESNKLKSIEYYDTTVIEGLNWSVYESVYRTEFGVTMRFAESGEIAFRIYPYLHGKKLIQCYDDVTAPSSANFIIENYDSMFFRGGGKFLISAAIDRVRYPYKLSSNVKTRCLEIISDFFPKVWEYVGNSAEKTDLHSWLMNEKTISRDQLTKHIDTAVKIGNTELSAFLLEYKNRWYPNYVDDFDLN